MPYIGRDLNRGNYLKLDDISSSFNGSTQTFNLTVGGSAFRPGSAFSILVSVGGVIQEPESAYQVNNSEITFANAPTAQDGFFCIALGVPIGIGVPGNGTVNGTQVAKPFNYDGYFYLDDANNRVGIGSLQPTVALDVDGIIKASSFTGGSGGINAGVVTCTGLDLNGNGDVSGNFIIGGDLTVNGTTSTIDTNLIGVDKIEVTTAGTNVGVAVTQNGTGDLVRLYDGTSQIVTVDDEGKIGLGTATPGEALHLGDNQKIALGYGEDLTLNHQGANSVIFSETGEFHIHARGTGDFYLKADNDIFLRPNSSNEGIKVIGGGAIQLYHAGNKRAETLADGFQTQHQTPVFQLFGENATGTRASNGYLNFYLRDGNSNNYNVARVLGATDNSNGGYGCLQFQTAFANSLSTKMIITREGNVGIGSETPSQKLDVVGTVKATLFSGSGASLTGIVNANVAANAAIAGSKIAPNFGTQTLNAGLGYFSNNLNTTGTFSLTGGTVQINLNRASHTPVYRMSLTGGSNPTMNFRIKDTTNNLDRFIIRHGGQIEIPGDVGIGHTVNFSATNISKFGGYSTLHIKGPSNEGAAIRLQDNGDTADSDDFVIYKNYAAAYLRVNGTDPLKFYMNGSDKLLIGSNGEILTAGVSSEPLYPHYVTARKVQMEVKGALDVGQTRHHGSFAVNCTNSNSSIHLVRSDNTQTDGTHVGVLGWVGYDGSDFHQAAAIEVVKGAGAGSNDQPGHMIFKTNSGTTSATERLRIKSDGGMRLQKDDGNGNFTISRNASVTITDQPIGVLDFASNTAHTVQARVMGKTRGTSNVGGDLVVETRAEGGSLDERFRITGSGQTLLTRGSQGGRDSTGNASNFMKIGTWYGIDQTSRLKITVFGTATYDSNADVAGETIIYISSNANYTLKGHFHSHSNNRNCVQKVAFKYDSGTTSCEVWIKYNGSYSCTQHKVDASEGYWVGADVDTSSTSVPSGATEASSFFTVATSDGSQSYERFRITSDGKVCINNDNALSDLHICTAGSSEQDGTFRIGGSSASLGLVLDYDQAGNTVSKITANPTYTNGNALLKISVDGNDNPDQLVLNGSGKIGINIADNTAADLQVRTGNNGAGVFRLGGSSGNGVGMDATYSNSGATSTIFKQNYRSTHSGALMAFDSGYMTFHTGTSGDTRLKISKHGQLLHGNSSEDQGWAVFFNAVGSGNDAGTAGADGGGDKGVNIRTDMGPTHLDLTGIDNFTLKLANQAYSGAGVANPYGTISKILFNTVTYNGWNSYGGIALQSVGVSAARGQMVFLLNDGTSSMAERMRIAGDRVSIGDETTTGHAGMFQVIHNGGGNQTGDTLCHFETNANDWIFQLENDEGAGTAHFVYFKKDGNNPGSITSSNTSVNYNTTGSDRELKKNFESWTEDTLSLFKNINPQKFNFKIEDNSAEKTKGFIAQDMLDKFPEAYPKDRDGYYKFNPSGMVAYLMKALQEEIVKREALEARISALEGS